MPAGVSWSTYLKFLGASMLTMLAGAQVVHNYYKPLEGLDELIQIEVQRQLEEMKSSKQSELKK